MKREALIYKVIVLFSLVILFSACRLLNNPVDTKSADYIGVESLDLDGDGIGQWADVDEIVPLSPEDGAALDTVEPVLTVYQFNPAAVSAYHIQISTSDTDFESVVFLDKNDFTSNQCTVPAGKLLDRQTYYWRAKAYDGTKWSDTWSEVWSFSVDTGTETTVTPENGGTTRDTTPLIDWFDIAGASGYHIQVNVASNFMGTMIVDENTLTAS